MAKPIDKRESAARYERVVYHHRAQKAARPGQASYWKRMISKAIRRFWKKEIKNEDSQ